MIEETFLLYLFWGTIIFVVIFAMLLFYAHTHTATKAPDTPANKADQDNQDTEKDYYRTVHSANEGTKDK